MAVETGIRFATLESLVLKECKICHGLSKSKCFFCGQKCPAPKDLNEKQKLQLDAWRSKIEHLKKTYRQLIALKQRSTGCEEVDAEIRKHIGNWQSYIT